MCWAPNTMYLGMSKTIPNLKEPTFYLVKNMI